MRILYLLIVINFTLYSQQFDFEWINTKPQGNRLWSVHAFDENHFVAAGDAGTIMTTYDGGNSWEYNFPDSNKYNRTIQELRFMDDLYGYACGSAGLMLKTTNGGLSWESLTLPYIASMYTLHFINRDTGFVAGAGAYMYRTFDGGATWTNISLSNNNNIQAIQFVNNTGYIVSFGPYFSNIYKSTDLGSSWTAVNISDSFWDLYFVNQDSGFACTTDGSIYKTNNGGVSWNVVYNGDPGIYSIKIRGQRGVASGYHGKILISTDAGNNWILDSINCYQSSSLQDVDFTSDFIITAGNGGIIAKKNAGLWTHLFESFTRSSINDICFPNNNVGYLGGYNLHKTTDGGNSWQVMPFYGYLIKHMYWINENLGYIDNTTVMYKTTDGGNTFAMLDSVTGEIEFINADTGFCAQDNFLYRTTNGGANWVNIMNYPYNIGEVYIKNNILYVSLTSWGYLYKSYDWGNNFVEIRVTGAGSIHALYFIDEEIGFAGGGLGSLYKTTDGGINWVRKFIIGQGNAIEHIDFKNNLKGWCSTDVNGILHYTTDGGASWIISNKFHVTSVKDFQIIGENLWFVGWEGKIIKGLSDPNAVPVELISFTAETNQYNVTLRWETAAEQNNKGFEVQRKQNTEWNPIGFVEGSGTTPEKHTYRFIDGELETGKYTYRLKQLDFDGTFEYSNEIEVDLNKLQEYALDQNYPNPFNPSTNISYSLKEEGIVKLLIYDIKGELISTLVNEKQQAGSYELDFTLPGNISTGVYIYRLTVTDQTSRPVFSDVKKMVFLK